MNKIEELFWTKLKHKAMISKRFSHDRPAASLHTEMCEFCSLFMKNVKTLASGWRADNPFNEGLSIV